MANDLVTWEPDARQEGTERVRPRQSYLSTLLRDVEINSRGSVNPDAGHRYKKEDICDRSDVAPT